MRSRRHRRSGPLSAPKIVAGPDAAARASRLAQDADCAYSGGDFSGALSLFDRAVQLSPNEPQYHYKLALAAWRAGESALVEPHLVRAIELAPQHPAPHEALSQWALLKGDMRTALRHSQSALASNPHNPEYVTSHALVLIADGRETEAWDALRPLIESGAAGRRQAAAYAQIAPKLGQEAQALQVIQQAMGGPDLSMQDKAQLHFAAAALLDRLARYDEAFEHARLGNECRQRRFDPREHRHFVSELIEYFNADHMRSLARATHGERRCVFIVGVPRSGTSLVEQILASHPRIFGAGELRTLAQVAVAAAQLAGGQFPQCFDHLSVTQVNDLAARYLNSIAALNRAASIVTDKTPENFHLLGMIELLLPDARVIHCVRDARDTCLSCYFTDFHAGNEFSFDVLHLACYFRDYQRLMQHWRGVLRLPMLDVRYEELVDDLEGQTRRMLEFLELPWDQRCVEFHQSKRHVATASRDQVRRPIYRSSIGRWKHYRTHLGELLSLEDS